MKIISHPSANADERPAGTTIDLLVIHTTCVPTVEEALTILCDPGRNGRVSAHYVIGRDGTVYQLVDEKKRAWHAGESSWEGQTDLNSRSIGVEIQNAGNEDFPPAQMRAVRELCRAIVARHNIPAGRIVGHSDIAPHRKQDPGAKFDWKNLARHGLGLWPKTRLRDAFNLQARRDKKKLAGLFRRAGYGVNIKSGRPTLAETVTAFQRHFEPEAFAKDKAGKVRRRTLGRLKALIRARENPR